MTKRYNVVPRVIPFTTGEYVVLGSGWKLSPTSGRFDRLRAAAASERETATMLDRRIKELRHQTTE
ncbi:hypothetical protein SAMN04487905_103351 [Actinopolyspora xinjiangensis]|uniref:Uncharacterized protein n=2 Tax=Actinopolyspora TaxID=1849 RepID=A0ABR4X3M5_9ACTN|nr:MULTISPECIES: hypothetical protein [Actinopolyspora]KGI81276.1 hypothetical protein IL38_12380 [Actinopolyspora erythraea]SDP35965.1 hypothetical protein SAMN04487905_103351 [Actinopolyspora xinjiangensis]